MKKEVNTMAKELNPIDVTDRPELLRIAEEVHATKEPRLLRRAREDLAILTPAVPAGERVRRGRAFTMSDSLWNIVGIGRSEGPTDVAQNKHEYLAEAYADHAE